MYYLKLILKNHFKVLNNSDLRNYMGSQLFWQIGLWILTNTYALLAFNISDKNPITLGYISLAMAFGVIFANAVFHNISNKKNKFEILIALQITQVIIAGGIAFLIFSGFLHQANKSYQFFQGVTAGTIILYIASFISGITAGIHFPTNMLFLKDLIKGLRFKKAVGINAIVVNSSRFIAPVLAGALISYLSYAYTFAVAAFFFVPISYILSGLTIEETTNQPNTDKKIGMWKAFKLVLIYYKTRSLLLNALLIALLGFPLFKFAPDIARGNPVDNGFLLGSFGFASLICLLFITPFTSRGKNIGKIITIATVWSFWWLFLFPMDESLIWGCLCFFFSGIGATTVLVTIMNNIGYIVPKEFQSKVLNIFSAVLFAVPAFSTTVFGFIIKNYGSYKTIEIASIFGLFIAIVFATIFPKFLKD